MPQNPELKGSESVASFPENSWSTRPQGIHIRVKEAKELPTCLTCGQESRLGVELSTREGGVKHFNSVLGSETGQSAALIGRGGE